MSVPVPPATHTATASSTQRRAASTLAYGRSSNRVCERCWTSVRSSSGMCSVLSHARVSASWPNVFDWVSCARSGGRCWVAPPIGHRGPPQLFHVWQVHVAVRRPGAGLWRSESSRSKPRAYGRTGG